MRILRCITSINPADGGPIEGIHRMTPELEALGHQVEIVCMDDPNAPWVINAPCKVHALGPALFRYRYVSKLIPWLCQHAKNYDVVIVHGLWQFHGYAVRHALKKSGVPYFVYPHGMLDPWFKREYPLKHLKKWLYWPWAEYRVLRDAQAVLFTCDEERRLARQSFWLYDCREEVVAYGTAPSPEDKASALEAFENAFPALKGKRILLFLSRLHEKKGVDMLIRAFGNLLHENPSLQPQPHLVIAGPPSDEDFLKYLQDLAWSCCPGGSITFTGMLCGKVKWGALHAAEAFILPSHQENFGIAVVEAMACGLPVLISDKVNIWREIIRDEAGLAESDTYEGVCRLLQRFYALSDTKRSRMGANAKASFNHHFHINQACESFLQAIGASPKSPPSLSGAPKKLRLLHAIQTADPAAGGTIEAVKQLVAAHAEMGHESTVVTLDLPDSPATKDPSLTVVALGNGRKGFSYSLHFVPWLKAHAHEYDAVIVHGLWQYHGLAVWKTLHHGTTPYYVYPHGMLDPWFKKAYPLKHLKKAIYWKLFENKLLRDAKGVLYTCQEECELARNTFRPYKCTERIVYLGIKEPKGIPEKQRDVFFARFPEYKDKRLLLFLSRLHDKKGCDLLIRAFGKLASSAPSFGSSFHLVMAGPAASDAYLEQLKWLAKKHCPEGTVTFPGMLRDDLKWGAFHAAEAFVLPSHQENFGIAVVEAMACRLPILISKKVNIWREIEEYGAGMVEDDTQEGTDTLLKGFVALSQEEKAQLRMNAEKTYRQHFHIQPAAKALLAAIS